MKKETKYIDEKTGEIRHGRVQYIDAAFDEEKGYLFWNRKKFPDQAKQFQLQQPGKKSKIW